jgi:hypothetical protein
MKLKNRDPRAYIGRTIFYKSVAWQITKVDDENVPLYKPGQNEHGRLRLDLFGQCKLYPEASEIRTRFPKLLRALRTACNLTTGEAENAVLGMIVNGPFFAGSEALAHIGGSANAVQRCWRFRRQVREYFARQASPAC